MHIEDNNDREELKKLFVDMREKVQEAFMPYHLDVNDQMTRDGIIGAMSRMLECYVKDITSFDDIDDGKVRGNIEEPDRYDSRTVYRYEFLISPKDFFKPEIEFMHL